MAILRYFYLKFQGKTAFFFCPDFALRAIFFALDSIFWNFLAPNSSFFVKMIHPKNVPGATSPLCEKKLPHSFYCRGVDIFLIIIVIFTISITRIVTSIIISIFHIVTKYAEFRFRLLCQGKRIVTIPVISFQDLTINIFIG